MNITLSFFFQSFSLLHLPLFNPLPISFSLAISIYLTVSISRRSQQAKIILKGEAQGNEMGGYERYMGVYHKVRIYKDYHSVLYVPSSELGLSQPLLQRQRVCPSPQNRGVGGGGTLACGLGESQFRRPEKKLSTLPTLCCLCKGDGQLRKRSQYSKRD